MEQVNKKLEKFYFDYLIEMGAIGAWSGKAYSQEYFKKFWEEMREFFESLDFNVVPELNICKNLVDEVKMELQVDYFGLYYKLVESSFLFDELTSQDWNLVFDALDTQFIKKLDFVMDLIDQIYQIQTGISLVEKLEDAVAD